MIMMRTRTIVAFFGLAVTGMGSGCDHSLSAAASQSAVDNLPARVKALEDLLPSQSHLMADVGDHFANLWFAGTAQNWPLAGFYLGEARFHLRWAVRRIPVRKDLKGNDIKLVNILEAFENSQLARLKKAIDANDRGAFESAYKESLTACYSCHKAADKPYLRPQLPAQPASRIINFDPHARWPL